MNLIKLANQNITMKAYERNLIMVITLLSTLLLLNIWPRFRYDALDFPWWGYVSLIVLCAIPLFINNRKRKKK